MTVTTPPAPTDTALTSSHAHTPRDWFFQTPPPTNSATDSTNWHPIGDSKLPGVGTFSTLCYDKLLEFQSTQSSHKALKALKTRTKFPTRMLMAEEEACGKGHGTTTDLQVARLEQVQSSNLLSNSCLS